MESPPSRYEVHTVHRIAVEIPIMAVAAALMASFVLIAGTAMEASTEPIVPSYALGPALCTLSYCEPAELVLTSTMRPEAPVSPTDQD